VVRRGDGRLRIYFVMYSGVARRGNSARRTPHPPQAERALGTISRQLPSTRFSLLRLLCPRWTCPLVGEKGGCARGGRGHRLGRGLDVVSVAFASPQTRPRRPTVAAMRCTAVEITSGEREKPAQ